MHTRRYICVTYSTDICQPFVKLTVLVNDRFFLDPLNRGRLHNVATFHAVDVAYVYARSNYFRRLNLANHASYFECGSVTYATCDQIEESHGQEREKKKKRIKKMKEKKKEEEEKRITSSYEFLTRYNR
ncbi:hypothetical protein PUN28_018237 [Cardiocondyla obscurior]|uniref:Uncharacterized protein n=1 Tax=Cardiocondyla obscurior TaxID=286306 RepID=A0AAW2EGH1_9HYME